MMAGTIQTVKFPPRLARRKKVAAYARVSSGKDAMQHSLSAQVSFYSSYIQSHSDWAYAGVYADEAISGTKEERPEFSKLIAKCESGDIEMVITKSISRFARNTVTLLETVRRLKALGVDVFFEEQNIHTISTEGELMMTILASYAQEESRSVSENMKWRIKQNFQDGILWSAKMLGYDQVDGRYEINHEEAQIVKRIFAEYLDGKGTTAIMKGLNDEGIETGTGGRWYISSVTRVLRNYSYTGNLIQQHKYRENHITHRTLPNQGELPKYHVQDSHEAIIDIETFNRVQEEILRRAEKYSTGQAKGTYPFSGIMICDNCGKSYRRKTTATGPVWICTTYNSMGRQHCASKAVPEKQLSQATAEVLGTDTIVIPTVQSAIRAICVRDNNILLFIMEDGSEIEKQWADRSRSESWTKEMRQRTGNQTRERNAKRNG